MRISLLFIAVFLNAQTLYDLSKTGLKQSFKIKSYNHQLKAKKHTYNQSKDNYLPSVSLNGSYSLDKYKYEYPKTTIQYNSKVLSYALQIRQPVYQPKIFAMMKDSKLKMEYSKYQLQVYTQQFLKQIALTYIDMITKNNIQKIYYERLENFSNIKDEIAQKEKIHFATKTDLLQASVKYINANTDYMHAKLAYNNNLKTLQYLTHTTIYKDSFYINDNIEFNVSNKENFQNNPNIKLAKINMKIAKNNIKSNSYQKYPTIDLVGSYSNSNSSDSITKKDEYTASLQINVPLYNASVNDAEKSAMELYESAKYDYLEELNSLKISFQTALFNLNRYKEVIKKDKEIIKNSELFLKKQIISYNNKLISLSDLYSAQNDVYYSQIQYYNDKAELLKNYINILFTQGNLTLDNIKYIQSKYIRRTE